MGPGGGGVLGRGRGSGLFRRATAYAGRPDTATRSTPVGALRVRDQLRYFAAVLAGSSPGFT